MQVAGEHDEEPSFAYSATTEGHPPYQLREIERHNPCLLLQDWGIDHRSGISQIAKTHGLFIQDSHVRLYLFYISRCLGGIILTKQLSAKKSSRDEKKSRIQREEKTTAGLKRWMILSGVGLIIVVAGVTVGLATMQGGGEPDEEPLLTYSAATEGHLPYPLIEADVEGMVRIPVETFDDYAAHYYTYMHDNHPIEFLVLKSEDSVVRAAFNACDVCYRSLKGYSQDGQVMVCNNCGSQFPSNQINIVRGGCNPSPLERSVEDEYLVINVDDIILGADYF